MAVQAPSEASSSPYGVGPVSVPPTEGGYQLADMADDDLITWLTAGVRMPAIW